MAAGQLILASARVCHGTWRFKRTLVTSTDAPGERPGFTWKRAEHVLHDIYSISRRESLLTAAAVALKPVALQHFPGRAVRNTGLPACQPLTHLLTHLSGRQTRSWCRCAPTSFPGISASRWLSPTPFRRRRRESICPSCRLRSCAQLSFSSRRHSELCRCPHFDRNQRSSWLRANRALAVSPDVVLRTSSTSRSNITCFLLAPLRCSVQGTQLPRLLSTPRVTTARLRMRGILWLFAFIYLNLYIYIYL